MSMAIFFFYPFTVGNSLKQHEKTVKKSRGDRDIVLDKIIFQRLHRPLVVFLAFISVHSIEGKVKFSVKFIQESKKEILSAFL